MTGRKWIKVFATRTIYPGNEILISYGKEYWKGRNNDGTPMEKTLANNPAPAMLIRMIHNNANTINNGRMVCDNMPPALQVSRVNQRRRLFNVCGRLATIRHTLQQLGDGVVTPIRKRLGSAIGWAITQLQQQHRQHGGARDDQDNHGIGGGGD